MKVFWDAQEENMDIYGAKKKEVELTKSDYGERFLLKNKIILHPILIRFKLSL